MDPEANESEVLQEESKKWSMTSHFRKTLSLLEDDNQWEVQEEVCKILDVLLKNIVENPDNEKYRRIKSKNSTLQKKLLSLPCGSALLHAIGFSPSPDGGTWRACQEDGRVFSWLRTALRLHVSDAFENEMRRQRDECIEEAREKEKKFNTIRKAPRPEGDKAKERRRLLEAIEQDRKDFEAHQPENSVPLPQLIRSISEEIRSGRRRAVKGADGETYSIGPDPSYKVITRGEFGVPKASWSTGKPIPPIDARSIVSSESNRIIHTDRGNGPVHRTNGTPGEVISAKTTVYTPSTFRDMPPVFDKHTVPFGYDPWTANNALHATHGVSYQNRPLLPGRVSYDREISPARVSYDRRTISPRPVAYNSRTISPRPVAYNSRTISPRPVAYTSRTISPGTVSYNSRTISPGRVSYDPRTISPRPVAYTSRTISPRTVSEYRNFTNYRDVSGRNMSVHMPRDVSPKISPYRHVSPSTSQRLHQGISPLSSNMRINQGYPSLNKSSSSSRPLSASASSADYASKAQHYATLIPDTKRSPLVAMDPTKRSISPSPVQQTSSRRRTPSVYRHPITPRDITTTSAIPPHESTSLTTSLSDPKTVSIGQKEGTSATAFPVVQTNKDNWLPVLSHSLALTSFSGGNPPYRALKEQTRTISPLAYSSTSPRYHTPPSRVSSLECGGQDVRVPKGSLRRVSIVEPFHVTSAPSGSRSAVDEKQKGTTTICS